MENLVFVFGTLKEGFPNFESNKGIKIPGDFRTKNKHSLVLVGERYSPWLILDAGDGHHVKGQVFRVNESALSEMDTLERIDEPDGYRKVKIAVADTKSGHEEFVYVYGKESTQLQNADVRKKLEGEYLLEHSELYRSRYS